MWILGKGVVTDVPRFPEEGGKKKNQPINKNLNVCFMDNSKGGLLTGSTLGAQLRNLSKKRHLNFELECYLTPHFLFFLLFPYCEHSR